MIFRRVEPLNLYLNSAVIKMHRFAMDLAFKYDKVEFMGIIPSISGWQVAYT